MQKSFKCISFDQVEGMLSNRKGSVNNFYMKGRRMRTGIYSNPLGYDARGKERPLWHTRQIAQEEGMTEQELTRMLCRSHIIYLQVVRMLYPNLKAKGFVRYKTNFYHDQKGRLRTRRELLWTRKGREFVHQIINNIEVLKDYEDIL